jgi:glycosyltransferase involved in cell wall biosynthesis
LVCFGGGAFTSAEKARIEKEGLSGLIHQTSGSDAMLARYYAGAAALVYPSKYEGFGLPPVEAMGFGCPIVVSNAPPMPEIVGEGGLYFEPEDEKGLCDQFIALANASHRLKWSEKARKRGSLFLWSQAARKAIAFYRELV